MGENSSLQPRRWRNWGGVGVRAQARIGTSYLDTPSFAGLMMIIGIGCHRRAWPTKVKPNLLMTEDFAVRDAPEPAPKSPRIQHAPAYALLLTAAREAESSETDA